jgi:glycosyltransferase involved in cell wall biosynthesis
MPSLYEGFGLPVLEAMVRGIPAILSREGSLPEVGGDAALYFDARDEASMTAVLMDIISDPELRTQHAVKGRANAAQFTWDRTARETLLVFRSAVGQ